MPGLFRLQKSCLISCLWAVLAALYYAPMVLSGFSEDEGFFAEQASRLLRGELPGLDFASVYPIGVHAYHALLFLLLGESVLALKLGLIVFFALWIPVVYRVSRFLLSPMYAVASTVLVMALTIPLKPELTGNWYAMILVSSGFFWALSVFRAQRHCDFWKPGCVFALAGLMKYSLALEGVLALCCVLAFSAPASQRLGWARYSASVFLLLTISVPGYLLFAAHPEPGLLLTYCGPPLLVFLRLSTRQTELPWKSIGMLLLPSVLLCACVALLYLPSWQLMQVFQESFVVLPRLYLEAWFQPILLNVSVVSIAVLFVGAVLLWMLREMRGWALLALGMLLFLMKQLPWSAGEWVLQLLMVLIQLPFIGLLAGTLILLFRAPHTWNAEWQTAFWFWILGVFLFWNTYPVGQLAYVSYSLWPFWVLLVWGAARLLGPLETVTWRQFLHQPALLMASGLLLVGCLFGTAYGLRWVGILQDPARPLSDGSAPQFPNQTFDVYDTHSKLKVWVSKAWAARTHEILAFIQRKSHRSDDVFFLSDGPEYYFLSDHHNPTRYNYHFASAVGNGQEIVDALKQHQVRWVILDQRRAAFAFDHPLLKAYLADCFPVQTHLMDFEIRHQRCLKPD